MADLLGMHQVSYGRIENNVYKPSDAKLKYYIDALREVYPDLKEEEWQKIEEPPTHTVQQKTLVGLNYAYIGHSGKQNKEDRVNIYQIIDTLRKEIEEKNQQIKEKDRQIKSLLDLLNAHK